MTKEWPFVEPVASKHFPRLQQLLLSIEAYEAIGDTARRKRAIIEAVTVALDAGLAAGFRPVQEKDPNYGALDKRVYDGGVVAYLHVPRKATYKDKKYIWSTEQVAYFLPKEVSYDGHTRQDKLERIQEFVDTDWTNISDAEGTPNPVSLRGLEIF